MKTVVQIPKFGVTCNEIEERKQHEQQSHKEQFDICGLAWSLRLSENV